MNWFEHVLLEGGPDWTNGCSGRGDYALVRPVDSVTMYPDQRSGAQTYTRTNRAWFSPVMGTTHTVFEHQAHDS